MADTPEPGSLLAIATFVGTVIAAIITGVAGVWKSAKRQEQGALPGEAVQASGVMVSDQAMRDQTKALNRVAVAAEKIAKGLFDEKEQEEKAAREELLEGQAELKAMVADLRKGKAAP